MQLQITDTHQQQIIVPAKPLSTPKEKQKQILDAIADDCLVASKAYIKQSHAPEGE